MLTLRRRMAASRERLGGRGDADAPRQQHDELRCGVGGAHEGDELRGGLQCGVLRG